ncbi:MAG: XTP/dITP diphosphohydrolase [Moorella sp. (in: firmicutes)]|nr:XTP/dITP diphosphohydrolase [Moorella sp. (in: firmicutes)]MDK2895299.1 XTP/dITP diphosphohydrolase [Moorella sp. (in: firmicutes)]
MSRIVVATGNEGKAREFRELLRGLNVAVATLRDFPGLALPEETGNTFAENAILKARIVAESTGLPSLGDDSGLEVDFLKGAPGVYSARFAGEPSDDRRNNTKLLQLLAGVPWEKRTARFRCALALVIPEGDIYLAEGTVEGFIAYEPKGDYGFGYDPLFYLAEYGKTLSELGEEIKNNFSHRARAVQNLWPVLSRLWPGDKAGG